MDDTKVSSKNDKKDYGVDNNISGPEINTTHGSRKCALCGKELAKAEETSSGRGGRGGGERHVPVRETVEGIDYEFDSQDCVVMFKRLKSVYGDRLKGLLGLEQFISDPFWNRVTPDEGEMVQIQNESLKGAATQDVIQIIKDPVQVIKLGHNMIRSAKQEVLIMFSTANAFRRQVAIGGPQLLQEVTSAKKDLVIRILTPTDQEAELASVALGAKFTKNVDIRNMEASLQTKVTIVVVDREISLAVELKDDSKDDINQALGSAVYSNSKSSAISYVAIFESLWKQVELIGQVNMLYKQLVDQQTDQREFISIAAHELRAPIQPILGLAEVLKSRQEVQMEKQRELLSVIIRNAKRLKELTENILDITRIENKSLELQKEPLNVDEIIIGVLYDALDETEPTKNVRLVYNRNEHKKFDSTLSPYSSEVAIPSQSAKQLPVLSVNADRSRLTQVLTNLIGNAVKFSYDGDTVTVSVSERDRPRPDIGATKRKVMLVRVVDTGRGIDPGIMPRLFKKFASKSEKGMGLGLFISKNIIEAHGGEIWADDTKGEKGAAFSFTIPVD
jgi:two-component system sensor histidine kinase VicK